MRGWGVLYNIIYYIIYFLSHTTPHIFMLHLLQLLQFVIYKGSLSLAYPMLNLRIVAGRGCRGKCARRRSVLRPDGFAGDRQQRE